MGYFSNGTEGLDYQEHYCRRCVHDVNEDCPVWLLHLLHNYEQFKDTPEGRAAKETLALLISVKDSNNEQCAMFVDVKLMAPTPKPTPKVSPEKARTWWVESECPCEH